MLAVLSVLLVQVFVSHLELLDHKLLHLHEVDHVNEGFDRVEDEDAQLVRNAAVAVLSHGLQHRCKHLSSHLLVHVSA